MKILSVRRGFASDHSSTSYEFLAVDRPLGREAREQVRALSSRTQPTKRRASFIYHVDGYDIPGGWEQLLRDHYDVMHSESYDWWTLGFAFNAPEVQQQQIAEYEFEGDEGRGVYVSPYGDRVIVSISCQLDPEALVAFDSRFAGEFDWEDEDEEEGDLDSLCEDEFLNFLAQIRRQLMDGDYRALYAVWEEYGWGDDEPTATPDASDADEEDSLGPPVPPARPTGGHLVERLSGLLTTP